MIQLGLILVFCYLYIKIASVDEVKIDGDRGDVIKYLALYEALQFIKSTNASTEYAEIMPGVFLPLQRYGEGRVSPNKAEWIPKIDIESTHGNPISDYDFKIAQEMVIATDRAIMELFPSGGKYKEIPIITTDTIEDIDSQIREAILIGEPQSVIDELLDKRNDIK